MFGGDVRWRGKLVVPEHAHPIVRRLIQEANAQQTTLTEVAKRAGVRRCSIMQWGRRHHPRLDQIEAALNVLGLDLRVGWRHAKETPPDGPVGRGGNEGGCSGRASTAAKRDADIPIRTDATKARVGL